MTTSSPATAGGGRPIVLLAAAAFASAATVRVVDPLLPQIAREFQTTPGGAAVVVTAFALAYGLCQLVYGPLGDRFGKYGLVTLATFLSALGVAASALADDLAWLGALRLLSGATAAAIIPLSMAHIGDVVAYDGRQAALARFMSGQILGVIFGQALGGVLGDVLGWRGLFLALGAVYAVIATLLWRELASGRVTQVYSAGGGGIMSLPGRYAGLLRSGRVRVLLGTVFAEGFLFFGGFTFLGVHLNHEHGLSYAAVGVVLAFFGLGGLAYTLTAGRLVRRLGERGIVLAGGLTLGLAFTGFALDPPWWTVPLPTLLAGLGYYLLHNTLQTNATQMAPEARGLAVSVFASCLFLGQAVGVGLAGLVVDALGFPPLAGAAGALLLGLALAFRAALPAKGGA